MNFMRARVYLLVVLCSVPWLALTPSTSGQDEGEATITVDVSVVNVLATVRDKKGRLINNLTRDDFILEEEGVPQEIRYFSRQTDLPLTLGLVVDTSVSQERLIEDERRASAQFFSQVLRHQKDLAFLISFDVDVELLQDLTDSRKLLGASLDELQIQGSRGGLHPSPVPTSQRPVGTALYDAVFLASSEVLSGQAGRKAVVLISDGFDYGSRVKLRDAITAAHRADVVVYSVRYFDRYFYSRVGLSAGGGSSALKKMARETGGGMFEVRKKQPLRDIFEQIQEELRSQYSLGYTPNAESSNTGFRPIKLRTRDKNLKVQTRSGYYPKPSES